MDGAASPARPGGRGWRPSGAGGSRSRRDLTGWWQHYMGGQRSGFRGVASAHAGARACLWWGGVRACERQCVL